jgi:pilus assembly protein CpaB
MMGGGTPKVEAKIAPQIAMSEVLVANTALQPGQALAADQVRWQKWPASSVDSSFITHGPATSIEETVKGTVVRSPLIAGQPITTNAIVHGNASGFMAAMLSPGMRAISIAISTDSGAGGFILPNDRVDVILIRRGEANSVAANTILTDVRVLAVDQTFKQEKDAKTVIGKTATLELTPGQAQRVARATQQGSISLSLRPLADDDAVASNVESRSKAAQTVDDGEGGNQVSIIRYGIAHDATSLAQGGKPQ